MTPRTPRQTLTITQAELEVTAIRDALRGAILALEVERAAISDVNQDIDADLQAIMGLGVLLNDLQERKTRLTELSRRLPSPNCVKGDKQARLVKLMSKVFDTADHIRNIQSETYRLARLNLRAASHKALQGQRQAQIQRTCVA